MTLKDRQAAVKTAGERLESIETWMRRTFVVALVSAHLIAVMTFTAAYGAFEYMRIKSAVSEAQATAAKSLEEFRKAPARKAVETSDLRDTKAELAQLAANTRAEMEKTARDMRTQYERNAMVFDLTTKKQMTKFYEDTAKKAADDRVNQERP